MFMKRDSVSSGSLKSVLPAAGGALVGGQCRALLIMALVCVMLLGGRPAFSQEVVGGLQWGPALGLVSADSANIRWKTNQACICRVLLGENPMGTVVSSGTFHQTTLEGLKENSAYSYQIEMKFPDGTRRSQTFFFNTPKKGLSDWDFVVFGDTRTNDQDHKVVVDAVQRLSHQPQFVIHTGDMVENGFMDAEWNNYFAIEGKLIAEHSFVPCLGNHDRESPTFYNMFFNPLSFDKENLGYHSFCFANALFIVLDSEVAFQNQSSFLERILSQYDDKPDLWKFVIWHRAPYSSGSDGGNTLLASQWVPIMEKHHVTCGFYGHNHLYEHSLANGVHHMVSGGGGAPLYQANKPNPYSVKVVSKLHFLNVHVSGNEVTIQAVTPKGGILDTVKIQH